VTTLWEEASLDHEVMAREAALSRVQAELEAVMPFLLAARTDAEYGHRRALAWPRLEAIALRHGADPREVLAVADRQYGLMTEALAEGIDPVDEVCQSTSYSGRGPEEPDFHDMDADFSHGYSEVPRGNLVHVDDSVVQPGPGHPPATWFEGIPRDQAAMPPPPPPNMDQSLADKNASRKKAKKDKKNKKVKKDKSYVDESGATVWPSKKPGKTVRTMPDFTKKSMRKKAQGGADYTADMPPDTGLGSGSTDVAVGTQTSGGPPSVAAGAGPNMPAGTGSTTPITPPSIGQVTSSRDPVHAQVIAVTASVRATNPWLPEYEARRIAREAVGRYFGATDWTPNIMNDSPPVQSGGRGGGGGGGTSPVGRALEWQGIKGLMPGGGGAGGGGGGAAGELGELAEAAAL
jgi:hypothetical protein